MRGTVYRYDFGDRVSIPDLEETILLALVATESLHGECQVQLAAPHYLDRERRICMVDATTPLGADFNRLLLGFLRREFGHSAFQVRAMNASTTTVASAA